MVDLGPNPSRESLPDPQLSFQLHREGPSHHPAEGHWGPAQRERQPDF